jgi:signal transduction histidine kinase
MARSVVIEGDVAGPLIGMPSLLRRALGNLIDNAVLYGGCATVRASDTADGVTLRIGDNGPGMPEAELERVFEPFYRLEASRSRATGGSGLGLGIARNLLRLHGGDVVLRNRPEGGLEAVVTLPRGNA